MTTRSSPAASRTGPDTLNGRRPRLHLNPPGRQAAFRQKLQRPPTCAGGRLETLLDRETLMRSVFAIMISLSCLQAIAAGEPQQEIRFCPGDVARTYPLDSRGRVQSLLVPHVAVINHAATAFTVSAIHLELLKGGQVVDARHLDAADIQRFASNGPDIQEVFCGTDLIAPGIKLAGPELHTNEGLVVTNQVFAFNERRDTLRVRAEGASAGKPAQLTATLPVTSDFPKTGWLFPVRGVSYIGWGPSLHTAHRWVLPEAYVFDIARLGAGGLTYRADGARFSDYYAYGTEIRARPAARWSKAQMTSRKISPSCSCRTNRLTPTPLAYGKLRLG
jgi:hypothetical protein